MGCAALLLENGRMVACGLDESYVAYELLDKGMSIDDVIVVGMSPSLVRHVEETGQRPDDVSLDGGIACLPGEEENPQWWLLTRDSPPGSTRIYGAGFRSDVDRVRQGAYRDVTDAVPVRDLRLLQRLDQAPGRVLDGVPSSISGKCEPVDIDA